MCPSAGLSRQETVHFYFTSFTVAGIVAIVCLQLQRIQGCPLLRMPTKISSVLVHPLILRNPLWQLHSPLQKICSMAQHLCVFSFILPHSPVCICRAALLKLEEDWIQETCAEIAKHKPDVVITEKGLSDLAMHYLSKANISAIRRLRKTDNNRIARATGATIVHRCTSFIPQPRPSLANIELPPETHDLLESLQAVFTAE